MAGLSVGLVCLGALVLPATAPAGADQISSTRGQVQALRSQLASGAARIRALTLAYDQANTTAAALAQQAAADQVEVSRLRAQADLTRQVLRQDAIIGYTGGATNAPGGAPNQAATSDPAVRAVYLQVAAGDVADTIDQYRTQEAQVSTAISNLNGELKASQAAARATDSARQAAIAEATTVQDQLDQAQSRLTQLLAAQAQAAAQARAVAADQAAQAAQAAAAARAATPTQGTPVNDGLVAVVRSMVGTPTPAPTPAAPTPAPPTPTAAPAGGVWLQLRLCESGDNYRANTGNGFYGAYQFGEATWVNLGYPGRPDLEPPAMQDQAAQRLEAQAGWGQWPSCAAALGLG